ncbi:PREDICTED: coiled-coil domain-containing protein 113-like [Priapulus caudatus]|uniref:Cilia- and flagella-associated protein 263 n=1 Tax=Priapulus caudatus TaxID=37621 RepID=A0ABM1FAP3_PRICU|nr:PREDICTED: coiled-coil domain-containing protein 113-like [Priapulus caudatus]
MLEWFCSRIDPKDLQKATATTVQLTNSSASTSMQDVRGGNRKRSKSRSSSIEKVLKLLPEQKCDIAQAQIEEIREALVNLQSDSEKILSNHKAVMEEAEMRSCELKKSEYEFERDIIKGAVNPRSGKIISEKIVRHFEDKMKSRDGLIEKLRLKNSTLKVQLRKLRLQLKQKEEMGEVLHEVDFHQLKIENSQYLEKIDERNQELLQLKMVAGNTMQILSLHKKKLQTLMKEAESLAAEIDSRNELLKKIISESSIVQKEKEKANIVNQRLTEQLSNYRVPETLDYVNEKARLYELRKSVQSWKRKVEIAEMALGGLKRNWQQLKAGLATDVAVKQHSKPLSGSVQVL